MNWAYDLLSWRRVSIKTMVRRLAKHYGLPNWDKPSSPCLASRIPYGEPITPERLQRIDRSEALLRNLGFRQLRVRDHGTLARVELPAEDIERMLERRMREAVVAACREAGYTLRHARSAGIPDRRHA